jgi:hypothetical protein
MKSRSNIFLSPIAGENAISVTTEVTGILATGFKKNPNRVLCTADLWNIQRRKKARTGRRYF